MENQKLKEILELINQYYNGKFITDEEMIDIADHCLKTSNYNSDLKELSTFSITSLVEKINEGGKYIAKFDAEAALKNHKTKLELKTNDLKGCYDNHTNLYVYFDVNGSGKLKISLNPPQHDPSNNKVLKTIDDYSKQNNKNGYGYPTKIAIPYSDIKEIYDALDANSHAKATLNTAVSLSKNDNYNGRVTLVLTFDDGTKSNTFYDTFCITPPEKC